MGWLYQANKPVKHSKYNCYMGTPIVLISDRDRRKGSIWKCDECGRYWQFWKVFLLDPFPMWHGISGRRAIKKVNKRYGKSNRQVI